MRVLNISLVKFYKSHYMIGKIINFLSTHFKIKHPESLPYTSDIWKSEDTHKTSFFSDPDDDMSRYFIESIIKNTQKTDSILDIFCNQGRHLRKLYENGYRHLYGCDIMEAAVAEFNNYYAEKMPEIDITLSDSIEYICNCKDHNFDYLIAFPAALELLHPFTDIFYHMHRITRKGAIFIIDEIRYPYPRFWHLEFRRVGFRITNSKKIFNKIKFTLFILKKQD